MISKEVSDILRKLKKNCPRCHGSGFYHEYNKNGFTFIRSRVKEDEKLVIVVKEKCILCTGTGNWRRDEPYPKAVKISCRESEKHPKCKL